MHGRKEQIIQAATTLFLSEGVGVSTARIAKAAGVSNGTLFNAFSTKQALIDELYLSAKTQLSEALTLKPGEAFNRETLRQVWCDYLAWGRANQDVRKVMHLLLDSGLASESAQSRGEQLFAGTQAWFHEALTLGIIRGPSVEYLGMLVLFQLDLVVTQDLKGEDEALAFEMLCNCIGLK